MIHGLTLRTACNSTRNKDVTSGATCPLHVHTCVVCVHVSAPYVYYIHVHVYRTYNTFLGSNIAHNSIFACRIPDYRLRAKTFYTCIFCHVNSTETIQYPGKSTALLFTLSIYSKFMNIALNTARKFTQKWNFFKRVDILISCPSLSRVVHA